MISRVHSATTTVDSRSLAYDAMVPVARASFMMSAARTARTARVAFTAGSVVGMSFGVNLIFASETPSLMSADPSGFEEPGGGFLGAALATLKNMEFLPGTRERMRTEEKGN